MVMLPHTWMILFKKQLFDLEVKGQGHMKVITVCDTQPYGHAPHTKYHWPISKDKNVMARTRKYYLKNKYLTLRSKSQKGHYCTRHTALWSCTHIPNIIDLSQKTKCYGLDKKILFKKQLFDLEVKGQGLTKVITVCDTPPYGHAPTYLNDTI